MSNLIIIQPWFSAVGHPAQSLINTAKTIGINHRITYLISNFDNSNTFKAAKENLQKLGKVVEFPVKSDSIKEGTFKSLVAIKGYLNINQSIDRIFFLDAHLVLLALLWGFFYRKKTKQLGVMYLLGPERVCQYFLIKILIKRFLHRSEVTLYLRTEELVADWKKAFPSAKIKYLPSLEIPVDEDLVSVKQTLSANVRLGVLGQIRVGKGLDWLVPLFKNNPSMGKLIVAGTFNNIKQRQTLNMLEDFDGFRDKFLSEEELIRIASEQDYLLMLYDNWDHRLEGAIMFLAARVGRPVIVYDIGWCGRMVREYGNGIVAPLNRDAMPAFFKSLPVVGTAAYNSLLMGVEKFKLANSGSNLRKAFMNAILE